MKNIMLAALLLWPLAAHAGPGWAEDPVASRMFIAFVIISICTIPGMVLNSSGIFDIGAWAQLTVIILACFIVFKILRRRQVRLRWQLASILPVYVLTTTITNVAEIIFRFMSINA